MLCPNDDGLAKALPEEEAMIGMTHIGPYQAIL